LFTGGIPVLVLALCSGTEVAADAFKVIAILLSRADLPAEQVDAAEAQLVRMQAVPWLCLLLKLDVRQFPCNAKEKERKKT